MRRRAPIPAGDLALILAAFGAAGCLLSSLDGLGWQGANHADSGAEGDAGAADGGPADSGIADAGTSDAGTLDGGTVDAGTSDAATSDAGTSDAGTSDAGTSDAGTSDGGTVDAGTSDAATSDAGTLDAATSDAGTSDAGTSDAGTSDAGTSDGGTVDAGSVCPPRMLPDICATAYLSDDANCCFVGRSCQGGTCRDGRCSPVKIADTQGEGGPCPDHCVNPELRGIAADGQHVFWTGGFDKVLHRCFKDGTYAMTIPIEPNTVGLVLRGEQAYLLGWNEGGLFAVPSDGGSASALVARASFGDNHAAWGRLAMDDARACWAVQGRGTTQSPPGIVCAAVPSTGVATAVPLALGSVAESSVLETVDSPYGVAMDSQHVNWSDSGSGFIKRRKLDRLGENVLAEVVASGQSHPTDLALDAERVYWLSEFYLLWRPKDLSAGPSVLAQSSGEVFNMGRGNIAVDDSHVYWTDYRAGTVNRVRKDRPLVTEVLATNQVGPWGIAQDCGTIYWATAAGLIMKLAK